MKIERTKNAKRNVIFGMSLKVYQIIVPFVMRSIMIYTLGVQYLGLNGLFSSILQFLNLAELGVGSAMIYSMYKPIAEDDSLTICALMKLYRKYYRLIGLFIAVAGCIFTPFVPRVISGEIPRGINIYVLYLLNLSATVWSYWFFAYKNSILQAHQRVDLISRVTIITSTIQYCIQVIVLYFFKDYYLYVVVNLLMQAVTNIIIAIVADKIYPDCRPYGKLNELEVKQINHRIRDLFTARLGTVFGTSVDNIVISSFLGLTVLAIYQNYYYVMTAVTGIITVIFNSCTAGIGNSLITESPEKNYRDFKRLTFLTIWICIVCVSCFACLYQPFVSMWVGKKYLLPYRMVSIMCIYFYFHILQLLSCVYKDAAGIWHKDRFRPFIAGIANLTLNVVLVRFWGIYAIVLSTIASYLFIAMPWVIHNLFHAVFMRSSKEYVFELIKGFILSIVTAGTCYFVCSFIKAGGIIEIIVKLLITLVLSNIMIIIFRKNNEMFKPTMDLINKLTRFKFVRVLSLIRGE